MNLELNNSPGLCLKTTAIQWLWVAFFLFFSPSYAEQGWFQGEILLPEKSFRQTLTFSQDSVPFFKGSHRPAPAMIEDQTYWGMRYVWEAHYRGSDTLLGWTGTLVGRHMNGRLQPVWYSATRLSTHGNEFFRWFFKKQEGVLDFHSLLYGDGQHLWPANVLPEEFLWCLAPWMIHHQQNWQGRMIHGLWENTYVRRDYQVRGELTDQRTRIDDVVARLVRFERDDQAVAEFWVSEQGYRILKVQDFYGTWWQRFQ